MKVINRVRIKFDKLLHDTGKAILVRVQNKEIWLAHYMCKDIVVNKKLGGNVSLSVKVCEEKDILYDDSMATEFIIHHKPKKLDPSTITHDKNLDK